MEARIARLEAGIDDIRATVRRIEEAQKDLSTEVRDLRRDLKETELPAIREQLSDVHGQLKKTPTINQMIAIMVVIFTAAGLLTGANLFLGKAAFQPAQPAAVPR